MRRPSERPWRIWLWSSEKSWSCVTLRDYLTKKSPTSLRFRPARSCHGSPALVPGLSNVSLIVLERRNSVNCKEVIELVDAYLDGELDPLTNQNIEGHLRECSRCAHAFKEYQAFVGAIDAVVPYHKSPA